MGVYSNSCVLPNHNRLTEKSYAFSTRPAGFKFEGRVEISGPWANNKFPTGSIYTTIREVGPNIPYYRRDYGSQFPNGCICGPSGLVSVRVLIGIGRAFSSCV